MLATHPPLNCILSENFSPRQKAMKNGSKSDHLVFTLEDDISDQVLKSKSKCFLHGLDWVLIALSVSLSFGHSVGWLVFLFVG